MRIVGGSLKGRRFSAPRNLPVRPTTDFAKEALFNILANNFNFSELTVLDLFAGTGNMSFEFISRGCLNVVAVDKVHNCVRAIQKTAVNLELNNLEIIRSDAFGFLHNATENFDIIFADPPYDCDFLVELIELVMSSQLLQAQGWFILEHEPKRDFSTHIKFLESRKYGSSVFTIFG